MEVVTGNADPPLNYFRGSNERLRPEGSRCTVENHAEIQLSQTVHALCASTRRLDGGACHGQQGNLRGICSDQRSEAGLRTRSALFSLVFSAMSMDSYRDERPGVRIAYRIDGHLHKSKRMQARTRLSTTTAHDLLFADYCALDTTSEEDMQRRVDLFAAGGVKSGLAINTDKTVLTH
ncbi:hypothetical protein SprV_0100234900 [Sparganum proliferum]